MAFLIGEDNLWLNIIDATSLTVLLAPLLWWFIIRPIRSQTMEERMRAYDVIENTVDGIISIDENGIINTFNPSAEKIFRI